MTSPFQYKDVGELMGSWPLSFAPGTTTFQLQPDSLNVRAAIVGTVRETTDGYLVGGLSLTVYADVAAVPTAHTVTFPAGGGSGLTTEHYTLDEVVARFLASIPALPANTAQKSDNFLFLQSQTAGQDSYLRLESIPGAEGVFQVLGLQPEITVRGGDIKPAQHIDPTRQVAQIGQLAMQHGEKFSSDVINRVALQLGINAGRARGLLDLKKIGVRKKDALVGTGANNVQLSATAYTGAVSTPTFDQLKDTIVVLDEDGNEFTKEVIETLTGPSSDLNFSIEADTNKQLVDSATLAFVAGDVAANRHIIVTDFAVVTQLNNVPLKIIEYKSATQVVVMPIDPTDGSVVSITEVGRSGSRAELHNVRCEVEGFFEDAGLTTPLEQQQVAVSGASGGVSAVETPNRIRVDTANFSSVSVGDVVIWTGAGTVSPYNQNGTYRVSKVVDNTRLELVGEDCESVFLNLDLSGGGGTIAVSSDGDFFTNPYVKFADPTSPNFTAGRGAIPASGENYQLCYLECQSLRDAVESDPAILSASPRFQGKAASATQQALMRLAGPSVTSFNEIVHGNFDLSLEKIDFRVDKEHYEETGRHSTIRPDVVNMFPEVAGITHTVRAAAADSDSQIKFRLLTDAAALKAGLAKDGWTAWASDSPAQSALSALASGDSGFHFRGAAGSEHYEFHMAATGAGDSLLRLDVQDDGAGGTLPGVLSFDQTGAVGVNLARRTADTGWAGQPQADLHVRGRLVPESGQSGAVATVLVGAGAGQKKIAGLTGMTSNSVGRYLTLTGSGDNDGVFLISVFVSATEVDVYDTAPGTIPDANNGSISWVEATADTELVRLEGASSGDPTVALTFKPRLDRPFYGFVEMDHDNPGIAGDWNMNFVLTNAALTDSDGTVSEAFFRFVTDAGGTPREAMRILGDEVGFIEDGAKLTFSGLSSLVTLSGDVSIFQFTGDVGVFTMTGDSNLFNLVGAGASLFNLNAAWTTTHEGETKLRGRVTDVGLNVGKTTPRILHSDAEVSVLSGGDETDVLLSQLFEDSNKVTGVDQLQTTWATVDGIRWVRGLTYSGDHDDTASAWSAASLGLESVPGFADLSPDRLRFYRYDKVTALPSSTDSAMEKVLEFLVNDPVVIASKAQQLRIANPLIEFYDVDPGDGDASSNPGVASVSVRANTTYAMNIAKAWVRFQIIPLGTGNGVTIAVRDGFNVASVVYSSLDMEVTVTAAFKDTNYGAWVSITDPTVPSGTLRAYTISPVALSTSLIALRLRQHIVAGANVEKSGSLIDWEEALVGGGAEIYLVVFGRQSS